MYYSREIQIKPRFVWTLCNAAKSAIRRCNKLTHKQGYFVINTKLKLQFFKRSSNNI